MRPSSLEHFSRAYVQSYLPTLYYLGLGNAYRFGKEKRATVKERKEVFNKDGCGHSKQKATLVPVLGAPHLFWKTQTNTGANLGGLIKPSNHTTSCLRPRVHAGLQGKRSHKTGLAAFLEEIKVI